MTGNMGAGLAVGLAAGYVIGSENQKSRQRRLSHLSGDQILLKVRASKENVGEEIAATFENWKYKEGKISRNSGFSFMSFFLIAVALSFMFLMMNIMQPLGISFGVYLIIIVTTSFICGLVFTFDEIEYIKLGTTDNFTTVLIKKYDSDGYRNMDDDEIYEIVERLEDLYKKEKEVGKSLK